MEFVLPVLRLQAAPGGRAGRGRGAGVHSEEEVRDGMDSVSFDIRNSKNILLANYHAYRVTRSIKPAPTAGITGGVIVSE